jgi:hypothetical protein
MLLSADDPTILIGNGQADAGTTVRFDGDGRDVELRYSYDGSATTYVWQPPKSMRSRGLWPTPNIKPGQILKVCLLPSPSAQHDQPFLCITIMALAKAPSQKVIASDFVSKTGGTFHAGILVTTKLQSYALIEIGDAPPVLDKTTGIWTFPNVVGSYLTDLNTIHEFEITGLLPGNKHFRTIRISDAKGNWTYWTEKINAVGQKIKFPATPVDTIVTLRREVRVDFETLTIVNDSDPMGTGTASFNLTIYEGTNSEWSQDFGNDDFEIDDDAPPIPLQHSHTIGLRSVHPENYWIYLHTHGSEIDDPLPNEPASNWEDVPLPPEKLPPVFGLRPLAFPTGRLTETVEGAAFTLNARPEADGGDFHYQISGRYWVTYR